MQSETGIVLVLVLVLILVISLIASHKMAQMVLTAKTSASLQRQLFGGLEAENQLLEAELKVKKNPERYLSNAIGFVADHLEYGCQEGVQIFKVSVPPLESFVAVRMNRAQIPPLLNKADLLANVAGQPLSLLTAVDLKQLGTVDRLYAADQDHIWFIDLTNRHNGQPYQYRLAGLMEAKYLSNLRVVPDAEGNGVRLYFLGECAQKKGLYMIKDLLPILNNSGESLQHVLSEVKLIAEGDYRAFFVRFGRIVLIPTDPKRKPEALDLPTHQFAPVEDKLHRIAWRRIKK
ncbi:MAG TPA: hypothetical protein VGU44_04380 [Gammaproteobacteria bacterium]|nr:hypothetical protein [Gammaproteobacteria bacterium]